jgi:2-hydroxychromene-2-carboxylate isomerase
MSDQFVEQGGAATMDPSHFGRWLNSRVISHMIRPGHREKVEARAEKRRQRAGLPHRLEYFHQIDDAYSHLAVQTLAPLVEKYGVELVPHLVHGPSGANLPEPDLLPNLARHDAALVAPHYGLHYPSTLPAPRPDLQIKAERILAAVVSSPEIASAFPVAALAVGEALLAGDKAALRDLAGTYGKVADTEAQWVLDRGTARRAALGHFGSAMFHYGGQWYWGVDRLYHLERRFQHLGLGSGDLLFPRPEIDPGSYQDNGSLTLEFYASLRSPYTALIFDRAVELAERSGVRMALRPVLPMVMRGVQLSREKGFYIMSDAAREARAMGMEFGRFYDPIGEPSRRCYSLFPWAERQGKRTALMSAFLRAAFVRGCNTNRKQGLQAVVEEAGLDWTEAQRELGGQSWREELEHNRLAMYGFGAWGVPTFRLLDATGAEVVWAWGQDRLWLIAREIRRLLVQA